MTEYGSPTGTSPQAVSEATQARDVREAYDTVRRLPWTGPLLFYSGRDRGSDDADPEHNFGFMTVDFTPKPALAALADVAAASRRAGTAAGRLSRRAG